VDGAGAAGKSFFGRRLAAALGGAPIVPTDDFASPAVPIAWWPRLLREVIEPLVAGRSGRYRPYDWARRELADWLEVPAAPVVLIEGVSSGRLEWADHLALLIFVATSRAERLRRGLERDGQGALQFWLEWMASEDAYIQAQDPAGRADIVVDGAPNLPHDSELSFISTRGIPEP
jgi:uridine kinase